MFTYNGARGGVWEVKPMPPRPSSVVARIQAIEYCRQLNSAGKFPHDFYKPGSSGNAPIPFNGGWEIFTDDVSKKKFLFTIDPINQGAIYYKRLIVSNAPAPVVSDRPIAAPNMEPDLKSQSVLINLAIRLIESLQESTYHYDYIPTFKGAISPETAGIVVGLAVTVSIATRIFLPARNLMPIP